MYSRKLVFTGAILAAIGVGLGAIGAHFLPKYLESRELDAVMIEKRKEQFETGVRYHLYHSLAIIVIGLSPLAGRLPWIVASLMFAGLALFSGGIYGIVFGELATHVIVPFGGFAFIAAWIALAFTIFRRPAS
jgi:uncharacterized membrane protein YgdD (TMEM256/DUF423 family)